MVMDGDGWGWMKMVGMNEDGNDEWGWWEWIRWVRKGENSGDR